MPRDIEVEDLHQKAVLRTPAGHDDSGEQTFSDGEEINCRWERFLTQTRLPNGETIAFDSTVVVSRDIPVGSLLWEGTLQDYLGTGSELYDSETMQVVTTWTIPDIRNRSIRRVVGVKKYRGN